MLIVICALLNIKHFIENLIYGEGSKEKWVNFTNFGDILNMIFTVISLLLCFVYPCYMYKTIKNNYEKLNKRCVKSVYECFYEGLKTNNFLALMYMPYFLIRRLILSVLFVILPEWKLLSIFTFLYCSIINMIFLLTVKPFKSKYDNRFELVNEVTIIVISYLCIQFLDEKYEGK